MFFSYIPETEKFNEEQFFSISKRMEVTLERQCNLILLLLLFVSNLRADME